MELPKLNIENLKQFETNSANLIFAGGTCFGTCCGELTGCEDWEDDPEDMQ